METAASKAPAQTFRDLIVWQKAHQSVLSAYKLSQGFPREEIYALTSQFGRVAANIAEGFKKRGEADKARCLNIAHGSLEECRYYLILITDLGYPDTSQLNEQLEAVSKLLTSSTNAVLLSPES